MVRYYKKILIDSITAISQGWLIIGIIFIFGLVNVSAEQKCCYSTKSILQTEPNNYLLNITASHVNSKKGNNVYVAAISFPEGYIVAGVPYSPYNKMTCTPIPATGAVQFQCESRDRAQLFVTFDISIQPTPPPNSTIAPTSVFIYGDKCQDVQFCTNLAEKAEFENSDKISLGPFGTWPKYAVIIAGIILGITFLVACYLVYKRNRPDETYKDRSVTPGTGNYSDKRLFSPNSLLRTDDDEDLPDDKPPKNTLIQFGSVTARSPERSKSIQNRNQQPSLTKSLSKKKKDHQGIETYDNDGYDYGGDKVLESVVIEMSGNNGRGSLEKSYSKTRRNNDKNNNNVNRTSGYSTSDMSKTISVTDHEWNGGGDLSDNNKNEIYSSTTKKHSRKSSEYESRRDRKSSSNNNGNKPHRRSTSRENREGRTSTTIRRSHSHRRSTSRENREGRTSTIRRSHSHRRSTSRENREGRITDRTTSTRRHSHSRPRKNSFSPTSASKSTGDLHKSLSARTRQPDHNKNSSDANLNRGKSNKRRDLIAIDDTESIASSSDIPLGDRVPLAMLARSATKSWKPDNYNNNDNNNDEDDEDTTPLGQISAYGACKTATTTPSNNHADNNYDSVLNEVLDNFEPDNVSVDTEKGLSNAHKERKSDGDSDEEIPIGQLIKG